jgi:hypothetical protein
MENNGIESSPVRAMFWKDEILQVLYWMQGEGMGEKVGLDQMLPLLNSSTTNLEYHLNKLATEGFLDREDSKDSALFCLSEIGKSEGAKYFAEAFQGMQKAGHGECGPDCEFCYGPDGVKLDDCVHNCASQN